MPPQGLQTLILAGGAGERFWPLSRRRRPKQLLALAGDVSLVRQTLERALRFSRPGDIRILTSSDLVQALREELPEIPGLNVIGEPVARNTAPAIALGCHLATGDDPETVVVVLPSDHYIPDASAFRRDVARAAEVARSQGGLVTFGIPPGRPETGYGYIEKGDALPDVEGAHRVLRFHEKPDLEKAKAYQTSGKHFWNSGIFIWSAKQLLEEMKEHQPEIASNLPSLDALGDSRRRGGVLKEYYESVPSISIDYGVMEKSSRVLMVEARFPWSDLGTWEAWGETRARDGSGNCTEGDVVLEDARDNIVLSQAGGRVALLGVSDLVVVRTGDVTLVVPRARIQEVRDLVSRMKEGNREDPFL